MWHADHRCLSDGGMLYSKILQLDGTDPFATGLDDILRTVGDLHVTVGVQGGHVAGGKPAAGPQDITTLTPEIGGEIEGPRTSRSPKALPSWGNGLPSSSTISISTPNRGRPCLACNSSFSRSLSVRCLPLREHTVPPGLISVIPQACTGVTPNSSAKAFIIAGGAAAPPTRIRGRPDRVKPFVRRCSSKPIQMVGTPALKVICSCSNNSYRLAPSNPGPGSISLQPASGAP